ncbi:hypothetical protein CR970_02680 [Candidatus Saccharibacteria bacterium]|nr:MAG: hypothetical protein CR970_02680 [Candidatus Saccharibacteria bacterium]
MRYIYVDESGNLGKNGKYFVIAAIVTDDKKAFQRIKRIMKKACLEFADEGAPPLDEIHSTLLSFTQRQDLMNKLSNRADHGIFLLVADKKHLTFELSDQNRNIGYNYLSGILVKRIIRKYDDDTCFTFDGRSTKVTSRDSLLDYLRIKANIEWGYKHTLELKQADSRSVYCLQAADLLANVSYRAYRDNRHNLLNIARPRIETIVEFPFAKFNK